MFELKPDLEQVLERYEAWWECAVVDRPLVSMTFGRPGAEQVPYPESRYATLWDRWMDTQYQVESAVARLSNSVFYADALPVIAPESDDEMRSFDELHHRSCTWNSPVPRNEAIAVYSSAPDAA